MNKLLPDIYQSLKSTKCNQISRGNEITEEQQISFLVSIVWLYTLYY